MKPSPFGLAPRRVRKLISVNSSFAFLSGPGRPRETPTLRFLSVPLQSRGQRSNHSGKRGPASSETGAIPGCPTPPLPVGSTDTKTRLRPTLRTLVTSPANLRLLHCHIKNENHCLWLRELAALLNSEMAPVSGPHWLLHSKVHLIASASREMWCGLSLFPSHQRLNVDRSAPEPGSFFSFSFISSLLLVQTEPGSVVGQCQCLFRFQPGCPFIIVQGVALLDSSEGKLPRRVWSAQTDPTALAASFLWPLRSSHSYLAWPWSRPQYLIPSTNPDILPNCRQGQSESLCVKTAANI